MKSPSTTRFCELTGEGFDSDANELSRVSKQTWCFPMTDEAVSENVLGMNAPSEKTRELPVGSELLIAFALGAGGWYAIVRFVQWITG